MGIKQKNCVIIGSTVICINSAEYLLNQGWKINYVISNDVNVQTWCRSNNVKWSNPNSIQSTEQENEKKILFCIVNDLIIDESIINKLNVDLIINYSEYLFSENARKKRIFLSIVNNEKHHSVTWSSIDIGTGKYKVLLQQLVDIKENETAESLNSKCIDTSNNIFRQLVNQLERGDLEERAQVKCASTVDDEYLFKNYGVINFNDTGKFVERLSRALQFGDDYTNPVGTLKLYHQDKIVIVGKVKFQKSRKATVGKVYECEIKMAKIGISDGFLIISELVDYETYQPIQASLFLLKDTILKSVELTQAEYDQLSNINESQGVQVIERASIASSSICNHLTQKISPYNMFNSFKKREISQPDIITAIAVVLGKITYSDEKNSFEIHFLRKNNNKIIGKLIDEKCHVIVEKQWLDKFLPDFQENIYKQLTDILRLPKDISYRYKIAGSKAFEIGVYLLDEKVNKNLIFAHQLNIVVNNDNQISMFYANIEDKVLIESISESINEVLNYLENESKQIGQIPVNKLNIIPRNTYNKMIFDWNYTDKDYPKEKTIYELFQEQVNRTPNEIAVVFKDKHLTYKELNEKSNQLARYIKAKYQAHTKESLSSDTLIPLFLDRGLEVFISILAVLKAGGAYVPIDPHYPTERIRCIFENTGSKLLLTQAHFLDHLKDSCLSTKASPLLIAVDDATYQQEDQANLLSYSKPGNLAYVVYTSGTTGLPKGIAISHDNFIGKYFDIIKDRNVKDSTLICINYVFDPFVRLMFVPLLSGGKIILSAPTLNLDISSLISILKNQQIDSLCLVPSVLQVLLDYIDDFNIVIPNKVRCLYSVGERLERNILEKTLRILAYQVSNQYGPSEATGYSAEFIHKPSDSLKKIVPIGKPIANTRIYILDNHLNLTLLGAVGELHIAGVGLARGYLNQPELTESRFIPNPFASEEDRAKGYTRLYKTGDLVRWLPDGNLEYIGRNDFQVKIRGFRIELGEIEQRLLSYPGIKQVAVLAKERDANSKYLVAYYIGESSVSESALQSYVAEGLPEYMVPSGWMRLTKFPLTINGKLDRRALPEPQFSSDEAHYVAPRTELEQTLSEIWQSVLGLERVGVRDDFFRVGGDSILSIQASYRATKTLNIDVRVADIFRYKTIEQLAKHMQQGHAALHIPVATSDRGPISFAQERLWFIEQYEQGTNAYHIPLLLELAEGMNVDGLVGALQMVVQRHAVLRTVFKHDEITGVDQQVILEQPLMVYRDAFENKEAFHNEVKARINQPFNLREAPPLRAAIYVCEQVNYLLLTIHHVAFDGWSTEILTRELCQHYKHIVNQQPLALPELSIQYKDFAVWQRGYLQGELLEGEIDYWQSKLKGVAPLAFPTDKPRPKEIDYRGKSVDFVLDERLSRGLRLLAKQYGCTLYTVLLTGFAALLKKHTGQDDIVVGSPVANRSYAELEHLIGFFVNSLVLRTRFSAEMTGEQLLKQVHQTMLEAQSHQDLPFEQLVKQLKVEQDPSRHPIFQVMFGVQDFRGSQEGYFKETYLEGSYEIAKFDLDFSIANGHEQLKGSINYAVSLFNRATIERLIAHYQNLLEQLVHDPSCKLADYQILNESEYQQIVREWNQTEQVYAHDKTVYALFQAQVDKTPDRIAIVFEDQQLTYKELDERSNQLACYIRGQFHLHTKEALKPDTLIALYVERSAEMIIAILGVLKAGGAYVPIDPHYPKERVQYILEDTGSQLVLTQTKLQSALSTLELTGSRPLFLNLEEAPYQQEEKHRLPAYSQAQDLIYVIYTSGTTGNPKGVLQPHSNVMRLFTSTEEDFRFNSQDVWTLYHAYIFDFSVWELWGALLHGGKLVIPSYAQTRDMEVFYRLCISEGVTVLNQTPSAFYQFADVVIKAKGQDKPQLRYIIFGGEALNVKQLSPWWEYAEKAEVGTQLINMYGITETTVHVTLKTLSKNDVFYSDIGRPIKDLKTYVLDSAYHPVPIGVVGELYIGGAGLARGYLNRPELTESRFIPNPFASEEDRAKGYTRLYKTGDLVRWLPDGNLEYIGRNDFQVKIRGFRIELGEIEQRLLSYPGIKQAAVLAKERDANSKYLVAYYIGESSVSESALQSYVAEGLPEYMVPSGWMRLTKFPLTINGKLDRRALPEPKFSSDEAHYVAPRTELEQTLSEVWQSVLGLERVGVRDDFFRIGGDSILSIQVTSRLRHAGVACRVKDLFECRTIERLASYLSQVLDRIEVEAEQGLLEGSFSLLPIQRWFFDQVDHGYIGKPNHWNQSFIVNVPPLDLKILRDCLTSLVQHHDMLRVLYRDGMQRYQKEVPIPELKGLDVSQTSDLESVLTHWQSSFDLSEGPLWQIGYLSGYADGSARLYFALHHLIVDAVSWRILIEDIRSLYEGKVLGVKSSSYRQWVNEVSVYETTHVDERTYWHGVYEELPDYGCYRSETSYREVLQLDQETTSKLLQRSHAAYHTEINDLLLTSLAYALKAWQGGDVQGITLEGHGRESLNERIDVSRTLGWFTTMYPVKLEVQESLSASIKHIKESLRKVPNKGIGYGALFSDKSICKLPLINFNYLGQFDTAEGLWQLSDERSGMSAAKENHEQTIININGLVIDGQLQFSVDTQLEAKASHELVCALKAELIRITNHCIEKANRAEVEFTPSDFKTVNISKELLDKLQSKYDIEAIYPANSLQQGFIAHALRQPDDDAYRVQFLLDYRHKLDVSKLKLAWQAAMDKYPALRTCFNWKDELLQIINRRGVLNWYEHDISQEFNDEVALREIQKGDRQEAFDLTKPGLLRIKLVKHSAEYYTCILTSHHSILDGWSNSILLGFVHNYYKSLLDGKELEITNSDRAYLEAQEYYYKHHVDSQFYWSKKRDEMISINDPNCIFRKFIDPNQITFIKQPGEKNIQLNQKLYKKLHAITKEKGFTLNVLLQFAWHKLLRNYTGDKQTIVGTTVAGRSIPINGIEDSVGLYINTLPLTVNWEDNCSIEEQLQKLHEEITILNTHCYNKLASVQTDGKRLFHSIFIYENYPVSEIEDNSLHIEFRETIEKLDYPLGIISYQQHHQSGTTLGIAIKYAEEYIEPVVIEKLLQQLELILEQLCENIAKNHNSISLLSRKEYKQVVYGWNQTSKLSYLNQKSVYQLFEEQVERTPDSIALIFDNQHLSYKELNERSNQLARYIRTFYQNEEGELESDKLVVICVGRSLEMIIGMLGIWKSGAAYVPIDPECPDDRLQFMLEDTRSQLILTQDKFITKLLKINNQKTLIALDRVPYAEDDSTNLNYQNQGKKLAYVIYTSGTTGRPKGVMVTHQNLTSFIIGMSNKLHRQTLNCLSLTNYVFDIFGLEYSLPLITGGKLLLSTLANWELDLARNPEVNLIQQTPSVWEQLVVKLTQNSLNPECVILVGGEAINATLIEKLLCYNQEIINVYGPTETTIWSSYYRIQRANQQLVNCIGKALDNQKLYVLDQAQRPVPVGMIGELYIGGAGLARGYLNQPELTESRFIPNPFATKEDTANGYTRLYKTGDLVRWLPDGNLEYLGRNDFQVKIRGFRIELSEIESSITILDSIKQVAAIIIEHGENKYLVAYYVSSNNHLSSDDLIQHLSGLLPNYMIPTFFVRLDALPLTLNGKLDRRALPYPEFNTNTNNYVPPGDELENMLCAIWQGLLGLNKIGIEDDFFAAGGNSILSIRLVSIISERLKIEIPVINIFLNNTISKLSTYIKNISPNENILKQLADSNAKQVMYFIHPASAGCEVYQELAEKIKDKCISYGVDNYNLINQSSIYSLQELAQYYINEIKKADSYNKSDINLCGWSLGGQIALEMAYQMEKDGLKNINVYLFDTILPDENLNRMRSQLDMDKFLLKFKSEMFSEGFDEKYISQVLSAIGPENNILTQSLSGKLCHTKVILFKATQIPNTETMDDINAIHQYTLTLPDNNIQKYLYETIGIITLSCHHNNILDFKVKERGEKIKKVMEAKFEKQIEKINQLGHLIGRFGILQSPSNQQIESVSQTEGTSAIFKPQ